MAGREHMVGKSRGTIAKAKEAADADIEQVRNEIAVLKRVSMGHQNILTLVWRSVHGKNML
jgi:hypothetical protein